MHLANTGDETAAVARIKVVVIRKVGGTCTYIYERCNLVARAVLIVADTALQSPYLRRIMPFASIW